MSYQILDGRGRGYKAEVNSENQLLSHAITISRMGHISQTHGDAYIVGYLFEQQVAETAEYAGYTTYTGTKTLVLEKIRITTRDPDYTYVDMYVGTYLPTGGATGPVVNWNTTSSKTLAAASYHQNDGASSISATAPGILAVAVAIKGQNTFELDVRDAFVWRPNLTLSMRVTCKNANSLVRCNTSLYEIAI